MKVSFFQHRLIRKAEAAVIPEQRPPSRGHGLRSAGPGPESTRSSSPVPGSSWVKSSRLFFSTPRAPRNQKTAGAPRTRRGQRHIEQDEESRNALFSQTARLLSGFSPLSEAASQRKTSVTSQTFNRSNNTDTALTHHTLHVCHSLTGLQYPAPVLSISTEKSQIKSDPGDGFEKKKQTVWHGGSKVREPPAAHSLFHADTH